MNSEVQRTSTFLRWKSSRRKGGARIGIVFDIKRYAIHDGPGIRTTVFLKGCPLNCLWCHNPEGISSEPEFMWRKERCIDCRECQKSCPREAISFSDRLLLDSQKCDLCGACWTACPSHALELIGKKMTVPHVMKEIEKDIIFYDESGGGVTFSGGEPLLQPDFLYNLLKACNKRGIHTAVDTSGYTSPDILLKISRYTDLFLYDVKVIDDEIHKKYTGVSNTLILENLKMLSNNKRVIVRFPVIPGVNDDKRSTQEIGTFLSSLPIEEVAILPYHKAGIEKGKRLTTPRNSFIRDVPSTKTLDRIGKELKYYGLKVTRRG
jgi:pyruvate formate lyase activating enzyme